MASLAREFGVAESAIHRWKNDTLSTQAAEGGTVAELLTLRQRLRELELENQILKSVWLRRRSQGPHESFWQQAGRMQQM